MKILVLALTLCAITVAAWAQSPAQSITRDWYRLTKDTLYLVDWKLSRLPWLCETKSTTRTVQRQTTYAQPRACVAPKLRELSSWVADSTLRSPPMTKTRNELDALATRLESASGDDSLSPRELRAQVKAWQARVAETIINFNLLSQAKPGEVQEKIQP